VAAGHDQQVRRRGLAGHVAQVHVGDHAQAAGRADRAAAQASRADVVRRPLIGVIGVRERLRRPRHVEALDTVEQDDQHRAHVSSVPRAARDSNDLYPTFPANRSCYPQLA
jgi:hypothetical protein